MRPRLLALTAFVALLGINGGAQPRDANAVLSDMRRALGGDAALDVVKTWSVSGSLNTTFSGRTKGFSLELFAMLPDHFLEVKRDSTMDAGPVSMNVNITYYRGFRGDVLLSRRDSNIPFPPDPGPQTPDAIAQRERVALQGNQRDFARITVALFGKTFAGSPFDFSYVGPETIEGQPAEVVEMRSADGYTMRLVVHQATHLPMFVAWQAPPPQITVVTSSSTVTTRGGQVVSQSSPAFDPSGPPPPVLPDVTWRMTFADFKVQDGLNWPHRMKEMVGDKVTEDLRLGKFKINPKIDARKFNIGR